MEMVGHLHPPDTLFLREESRIHIEYEAGVNVVMTDISCTWFVTEQLVGIDILTAELLVTLALRDVTL
jgi:hypothetical protein